MEQATVVNLLKFAPKEIRQMIVKKIPPKDLITLSEVDPNLSKTVAKTKEYQELWKKELILEKRLKEIEFTGGAYYGMKIPKEFISDKRGYIKDDLALNYILQKLLQSRWEEKGGKKEGILLPEIQYLIQHGNYQRLRQPVIVDDYGDEVYENFVDDDRDVEEYYPVSGLGGAYSDLGSDPIYDIDVKFSQEDNVTVSSYKGNHEEYENYNIYGNLPYKGEEYKFSGLVYTRGI